MRAIVFILAAFLLCYTASALEVGISNTTGQVGSEVAIPVVVRDSKDLGGMNLVIAYNASILKPVKVEKGEIVKGLFSSDLSQAGLVSIGFADSKGISGEGNIAVMKFRVLKEGETPLRILHFRAYDVKTHVDVKAELKNGMFRTEEEKKSPGFEIGIAIAGLAALALRGRRKA